MKKTDGYIALISVILISAILLVVSLETSYASFFSRFNTLATEEKEESWNLAESCVEIGLVRLAENPDYQASQNGDSISIDQDKCKIISIHFDQSGDLEVETGASSGPAITILQATVELTNNYVSIKSLKEIKED